MYTRSPGTLVIEGLEGRSTSFPWPEIEAFIQFRSKLELYKPVSKWLHNWAILRGSSWTIFGDVMTSTSVRGLPHHKNWRETKKNKARSVTWKSFNVPSLNFSRHCLLKYCFSFSPTWCHKSELTIATNLSMLVNLIAQSVDLTISLPPNEDYGPNTKGSVSLILLRSLGWLTPLVNVSSKMARFPAKRQTNEPPWKQTTSTLKI